MSVLNEKIYVITENSCELYDISFAENKEFKLNQKISIIPDGDKKLADDTGCAIKLSSDNKYIYASLRGHNLICVFSIEDNLKRIQNISCFGKVPRDISFDVSGNFMFCANQGSDNISIFTRDKKTGYLHFDSTYPIKSPACIIPAL